MKIETVGSFLPEESLIVARREFDRGAIDIKRLAEIEDESVRDIVERQIACGVSFVTSGELRRKHWSNDFWFGLEGIECEYVDTGHLYQPVESSADVIRITGRIAFNPDHPFFRDFQFLHDVVAGRAGCRQTLPSPANLLLEIYSLSEGNPESLYPSKEALIQDIAEAYRLTAMKLCELGCESLQYDDTALGLMCDDIFSKRLLQGGVDLLALHGHLIEVINSSLEGITARMEKSVYISGGDKIVPEWEYIDYPDNIMPKALSSLAVDKFFLPFDIDNDYAFEVLRHIPKEKKVVLGLSDAHSPFAEDVASLSAKARLATKWIDPGHLAVSPRTGFKLSSYNERALTYADQWRKLAELADVRI